MDKKTHALLSVPATSMRLPSRRNIYYVVWRSLLKQNNSSHVDGQVMHSVANCLCHCCCQ